MTQPTIDEQIECLENAVDEPCCGEPIRIRDYTASAILASLRELRESQKDAARLDCIEKHRATVYAAIDKGSVLHWVFVDETKKERKGVVKKTLREAIDTAIKGSE